MATSRPPPVSTEPAPAGSQPGGRPYVPTLVGFPSLAIVLDVFSRRIHAFAGTGWAMAGHLRTELVLDTLDMAVEQRRPDSVIHHWDQGCRSASPGRAAYQRIRPRSIRPCPARSVRLSRRSPSRSSSNAGPCRKRAPSR